MSKKRKPVLCDYCQEPAELVTGAVVYPRHPDLADKKIWRCEPCGAWVGCHGDGKVPMGRLADETLRRAKMEAHSAFDRLWKAKARRDGISFGKARGIAYAWLAKTLSIDPKRCHIGMFDIEGCISVVEVCRPFHAETRRAA